MTILIRILLAICGIIYFVPMLETLLKPQAPPPTAPTVVVVESGTDGILVLLTVMLFVVAVAATALGTLWLCRRNQQTQRQQQVPANAASRPSVRGCQDLSPIDPAQHDTAQHLASP